MTQGPALALLLSLAGGPAVTPSPAPAIRAQAPAPETPRKILRLTLDEIRRDQDRAYQAYALGRSRLELSVAIGENLELWVKFRQEGKVLARTTAALESWNTLSFYEPARAIYENGLVRFHPLYDDRVQHTVVSVPSLIGALHDAALHVLLAGVEDYAVILEDGPAPPSVTLLRRDFRGRLLVTRRTKADLRELQWFTTIGDLSYGMRLEGAELAFYSKAK
jgi:hypothetical protein